MARTRSSKGPDETASSSAAGTKRAAATSSSSSPAPKRGKKTQEKEQITIEESLKGIEDDKDVEMQINGQENGEAESKFSVAISLRCCFGGL
jgi:hypothetical protein